ncbi:hypothetical protein B0H16DRAFT_1823253 [Mycena metata]|uniref:F-box domain-containing protein n=1 Tax=Mycena metata TaxID=1033252 RepID=A0AAD7GZC3_9AGAR|nr:hypothetical protein B0H16DRAFT_1823253 [Mycena metata]
MHELTSPEAELEAISAVFYNTPDPYGLLLYRCRELEQVVAGNLPAASRLPPELLSEIFLQFTPARLPPKADDPHLALPLVCRAWSSLVFGLQNLLVAFPINTTEFIPFLEQFPTTKQLGIYSTPTDRFPSSFWDRIRTGDLFPALTGLVLRPSIHTLPALVDVIDAKWENTEAWVLFVVWFTGGNASLEEVMEELKRLDKYDPDKVKRRVAITILFGPD